jgi:hypothetical protein
MRVVVHINTLVLEGIERLDGAEFEAALREHLQVQIVDQGWPAVWGDSLAVGSLTATYSPDNGDAGAAGKQVAQLLATGTGDRP